MNNKIRECVRQCRPLFITVGVTRNIRLLASVENQKFRYGMRNFSCALSLLSASRPFAVFMSFPSCSEVMMVNVARQRALPYEMRCSFLFFSGLSPNSSAVPLVRPRDAIQKNSVIFFEEFFSFYPSRFPGRETPQNQRSPPLGLDFEASAIAKIFPATFFK